jgi:hypothetical protein
MRRRDFITLLGAAAGVAGDAAWSFTTGAQSASMPLVGFLGGATSAGNAKEIGWIREGLKDTGFVEGKNAVFEFQWADGNPKRLEVIREAVPKARVFAMLVNSDSQSLEADSRDIRRAALSVSAQVHIIYAAGQGDPDSAFAEIVRRQVDAALVHPDSVLYSGYGLRRLVPVDEDSPLDAHLDDPTADNLGSLRVDHWLGYAGGTTASDALGRGCHVRRLLWR